MTANRKVTGTASTMPGGLAVGGILSLSITLVGSMITAWLIGTGRISETAMGYCAMGILLLSSFAGAMTAARKIKHRLLYVCGLSGLLYYGLLLCVTALFFGGQYEGMGVTGLVVLAGTGCAALLMVRGGKPHKRHKKRSV